MIFSSAPNDYLMHYGIRGQKWGIRRYQNPDGTLTAEGRRRYGYITTPQIQLIKDVNSIFKGQKNLKERAKRSGERYNYDKKINIRFNNLIDDAKNDERDDDYTISKEDKIYRIVKSVNYNTLNNESLYVLNGTKDLPVYLNLVTNNKSKKHGKSNLVSYDVINDIRIASGKSLVENSLKAFGYDTPIDKLDASSDAAKRITSAIVKLAEKDNTGKMTNSDAIILKKYLMDKGYGGVSDYNDKKIWGDTPNVIFDSSNNLKVNNIRKLNNMDKLNGLRELGGK